MTSFYFFAIFPEVIQPLSAGMISESGHSLNFEHGLDGFGGEVVKAWFASTDFETTSQEWDYLTQRSKPSGKIDTYSEQALVVARETDRSGELPKVEELEGSRLYSEDLGIALERKSDEECFKWFLASLLFGGRISETIAARTYKIFEREGLLSPQAISDAGWDFLVHPVMRDGGYVRYDESKSRQILRDCGKLVDDYGGSLNCLHLRAADARDLEQRLTDFYGVGPVTANIFLRELRPHWPKANPEPLPVVERSAASLGIDLARYDRKDLRFVRLEAGLIRLRRSSRRPPTTPPVVWRLTRRRRRPPSPRPRWRARAAPSRHCASRA
jgi:endonuclease III